MHKLAEIPISIKQQEEPSDVGSRAATPSESMKVSMKSNDLVFEEAINTEVAIEPSATAKLADIKT